MFKRLFDMFFSLVGLITLFPLMLIIALWIKIDSKGPVFYRQSRVGRGGIEFRIHKFRTMSVGADKKGQLTIGADMRITKPGIFLRKTKVDELPQLIDVLIGKMSLVGPRPEVKEFMDEYNSEVRKKILSVRPGITDYASIEMVDENEILGESDDPRAAYINEIMPIKQKYYLNYVESNSVLGDVVIIAKTIAKIISR